MQPKYRYSKFINENVEANGLGVSLVQLVADAEKDELVAIIKVDTDAMTSKLNYRVSEAKRYQEKYLGALTKEMVLPEGYEVESNASGLYIAKPIGDLAGKVDDSIRDTWDAEATAIKNEFGRAHQAVIEAIGMPDLHTLQGTSLRGSGGESKRWRGTGKFQL